MLRKFLSVVVYLPQSSPETSPAILSFVLALKRTKAKQHVNNQPLKNAHVQH
jgi:hypothetical protein